MDLIIYYLNWRPQNIWYNCSPYQKAWELRKQMMKIPIQGCPPSSAFRCMQIPVWIMWYPHALGCGIHGLEDTLSEGPNNALKAIATFLSISHWNYTVVCSTHPCDPGKILMPQFPDLSKTILKEVFLCPKRAGTGLTLPLKKLNMVEEEAWSYICK